MDPSDDVETDDKVVRGLLQGHPDDADAIGAWAGSMIQLGYEVSVRRLEDNTIEGIAF